MSLIEQRPTHGDVWENVELRERFSVMHVCGHHDPPHVTGYWWTATGPDPCAHGSIPLPRFVAEHVLVERDDFGPDVSGCDGCEDPDCHFH